MNVSLTKSIMSGALACVLGFAGGWLAKPNPAEEPPSQPVASSRQADRVRQISTRKQANLNEAEIRELGQQLDDLKDPKAAFAHGKLLAGMTLDNAELIGEYLEGNEYYFRLGELQKGGILELRETIDRRLRDQAIAGWVHSDFEGAMIWYDSLPRKKGEGTQKSFAKAIAEGLASFDLKAAEDFAHTWLDEEVFLPGDLIKIIFNKRSKIMDFPELGIWADQVTNNGALDWKMLTETANRAVLNDPAMAIEWASTLPEKRDWVNDRIASRWDDINPKACNEWLLTRPAGKERDRSVSASFHNWAKRDLEGSTTFLSQMEPSHDKDLALSGIAWHRNDSDPVGAVALVRQMENPERRDKQIFDIARHFWERRRKEAEAWFPESGLSPEQIEKIRSRSR
jgi:hypothetical protein